MYSKGGPGSFPEMSNVVRFSDFSSDLVKDWLDKLRAEADKGPDMELAKKAMPYLAVPNLVVEFLFQICRKLCQPPEVRYLTVHLFDKFVRLQFVEIKNIIWGPKSKPEPERQWARFVERLKNQALLRLLSCLQVASKVTIHDGVVRPKTVQQFLAQSGYSFTLQSIVASEIRILKTLDFKLHIGTVMTCTNVLLSNMTLDQIVDMNQLHEICILITDLVYLQHQEISHKLHYLSLSIWERTPQERLEFLAVECNMLLYGAAVLINAVNICRLPMQHNIQEDINSYIEHLTGITPSDVIALASIINNIIFT